jgi:Protein of unknown function (DUF3833)
MIGRAVLALIFLTVSTITAMSGEFRLEDFFRGKSYAEGSFRAINGVKRDFHVRLAGRWDGRTLVLVENFRYADGERDRKTWRFRKTGNGTYVGKRDDVVGTATIRIVGQTARYSYVVYLDPVARRNKVRFFDTMTLRPDGTVINTAWITKFGFPVARTRVEFRR